MRPSLRQPDATRARLAGLLLVGALGACGGESAREAHTARPQTIGNFIAEVDVAAGTIKVTPLPDDPVADALTFWSGLSVIPVVQNGIWGDVGDGAVELRNVVGTLGQVADGCGPGVSSYQADIEIHSGFLAQRLVRPLIEIVDMSDVGRESCWSVPSPEAGVGDQYGLFAYPDLAPGGFGTATWSFRLPQATSFTFHGRLMAEKVEATAPVTTASLPAGTFEPQSLTLACTDAESGCADTFYTVNGGPTLSYTGPIRLRDTMNVCFWSTDVAGNTESPPQCRAYTISAVTKLASRDPTLSAQRCFALGSACDSGTSLTGRAGTEVLAPNNLYGACADGTKPGGPTLDRLVVARIDPVSLATVDKPLAPGSRVRVTATLSGGSTKNDGYDVWYATNLAAPAWVRGASTVPPANGVTTISVEFVLPASIPASAIAIRGHYGGAPQLTNPCTSGNTQDDQDDLVFAIDSSPADTTSPTVSLTAPTAGATVSRSLLLTASAFDAVGVTSVAFMQRVGAGAWQTIGVDTSPPWTVSWDTENAITTVGSRDLRVQASDAAGNVTSSAVVSVTVEDRTAPTVAIATPTAGQSFSRSGAITLTATAVDARGVANVHFLVDGVDVASTTIPLPGSQFSGTWSAASAGTFATGAHTIVARATDAAGNVAQSARVSFSLTP